MLSKWRTLPRTYTKSGQTSLGHRTWVVAPSHVITSTMGIFTQFTIVSFVQQVLNLKTDFPVYSEFLLGVQLICMLNRSSQNIWMHVSNRLRPGAERFLVTTPVWQGEKRFMGQSDCPSSANANTFVAQNYKNKTLLCTLQTNLPVYTKPVYIQVLKNILDGCMYVSTVTGLSTYFRTSIKYGFAKFKQLWTWPQQCGM